MQKRKEKKAEVGEKVPNGERFKCYFHKFYLIFSVNNGFYDNIEKRHKGTSENTGLNPIKHIQLLKEYISEF
jgi:hypothetical protein